MNYNYNGLLFGDAVIECPKCGYHMEPVLFVDYEEVYDECCHTYIKTGRHRIAVDYLLCENCGHKAAVDDSFDGPWEG